jgi:hypothetical protein
MHWLPSGVVQVRGPAFVARATQTAIKLSKVGTSWSCSHPQNAPCSRGRRVRYASSASHRVDAPGCRQCQGRRRRGQGGRCARPGSSRHSGCEARQSPGHAPSPARQARAARRERPAIPPSGAPPTRPAKWQTGQGSCPPVPARDGRTSRCCRSRPQSPRPLVQSLPAPRQGRGDGGQPQPLQGISLARLMSVVVVVTVLVVIALSLSLPGERWGWRGKSGFAGTRLHVAEAQRRRRKLGGRRFGERRGKAPRPPLRRVCGDEARQGWKPDGRDAALQAARAAVREPGPEGDAPHGVVTAPSDSSSVACCKAIRSCG